MRTHGDTFFYLMNLSDSCVIASPSFTIQSVESLTSLTELLGGLHSCASLFFAPRDTFFPHFKICLHQVVLVSLMLQIQFPLTNLQDEFEVLGTDVGELTHVVIGRS